MKLFILLQLRDILEDTGGAYCDTLMRGNYSKHQLQLVSFCPGNKLNEANANRACFALSSATINRLGPHHICHIDFSLMICTRK